MKTDNIIVFGKNENFDFRFKKNDNHFEFFILIKIYCKRKIIISRFGKIIFL